MRSAGWKAAALQSHRSALGRRAEAGVLCGWCGLCLWPAGRSPIPAGLALAGGQTGNLRRRWRETALQRQPHSWRPCPCCGFARAARAPPARELQHAGRRGAPACCAGCRARSVALTPGPTVRWYAAATRWRVAASSRAPSPRAPPLSWYCTCAAAAWRLSAHLPIAGPRACRPLHSPCCAWPPRTRHVTALRPFGPSAFERTDVSQCEGGSQGGGTEC
jgi:hypothetical protein